MPADATNTRQRAQLYGAYGRAINLLYMDPPPDWPQDMTWEQTQAYAETHGGPAAPLGYESVRLATCYTAVYNIAFQVGFIDAGQRAFLESEAFRQAPLAHYCTPAEAQANLVLQNFQPLGGLYLYWFFRREEMAVQANLMGPVAHLMYALNGIDAAGSNNYTAPGQPVLPFAIHNLNGAMTWSPAINGWSITDGVTFLDIVRTPINALRAAH